MIRSASTLLYLLWVTCVHAQVDLRQTYALEYLGPEKGLPSLHAEAVTQDFQGLIWMACYNTGVVSYDGYRFKVYNQTPESNPRLTDNHVMDIITDQKGNLWISHLNGIDVLQPKLQKILHRISFKEHEMAQAGIVNSLYKADNGDIWATVLNKGIYLFPKGDVNGVICADTVKGGVYLNKTSDNQVFLVSELSGMYRYDGQKFLPCFPQLKYQPVNMPQIKPIEDQDGHMVGFWLNDHAKATEQYHYHSEKQTFEKGIAKNGITVHSFPEMEQVILRTDNPYNKNHLYKYLVKCFKDQQGVIWTALQYGGFFKLRQREIDFGTCPDLKKVSLRGMLEDGKGNMYIGTYNGLFKYNIQKNKATQISDRPQIVVFQPVEIYGDTMMAFSETQSVVQLNIFKPWLYKKAAGLTVDNALSTFTALEVEPDVYLAGNTNLFLVNAHTLKTDPFLELPVSANTKTFAIKATRNGNYWIGTSEGIFQVSRDRQIVDINWLRNNHRLGQNSRINDLYENNEGVIWIATHYYGLLSCDPRTGFIRVWDTASGLPSNETYKIATSHEDKYIWVSTSAGLVVIDTHTGALRSYVEADGTSGSEFNTGSFLKGQDGTFYWGGVSGLTKFHPDSFTPVEKVSPAPFISEVRIEDVFSSDIASIIFPSRDTSLTLTYSQNTLEFFIGTTDFFRPENNTFYVRLTNVDGNWVSLGKEQHIKYYHLPAGRYQLQIKLNNYTDQIYSIHFQIDAILYKKTWFQIFLAFAGLGAILGVGLLHKRRLRKEDKIKKTIADNLHNSLGGKISSLSHLLQVMDTKSKEGKPLIKEFHHAQELLKKAQGTLSDVIWVLSRKSNEERDLVNRMHDYADKWIQSAHIKVKFYQKIEPGVKPIPLYVQHECLLLYKELLGNILKHTNSHLVIIRFSHSIKSGILIQVQNEFTDRKLDVISSGQGFRIIQEHLENLKGKFDIEASTNAFKATISIPKANMTKWNWF